MPVLLMFPLRIVSAGLPEWVHGVPTIQPPLRLTFLFVIWKEISRTVACGLYVPWAMFDDVAILQLLVVNDRLQIAGRRTL